MQLSNDPVVVATASGDPASEHPEHSDSSDPGTAKHSGRPEHPSLEHSASGDSAAKHSEHPDPSNSGSARYPWNSQHSALEHSASGDPASEHSNDSNSSYSASSSLSVGLRLTAPNNHKSVSHVV